MFFKKVEVPNKRLKQKRIIVLSGKNKIDIDNAIKLHKVKQKLKQHQKDIKRIDTRK